LIFRTLSEKKTDISAQLNPAACVENISKAATISFFFLMSVNLVKTNQLKILITTEIYNYIVHSVQCILMKQSPPSY